jgi:tRNA(Ile)-lysidine synthase
MPPARRMISYKDGSLAGAMLVRPLIEASREEILDFLVREGLDYRTDRTNLDPAPLRNWIRLHLLPQVRGKVGTEVDERLAHLADILREEEEILEREARQVLERVVQGNDLVRDSLLQLGRGMQRRLLRLWLGATLGEIRGFGFHDVEEALHLIANGPPQGRLSILGGWELVKKYGTVILEKRRKKQKPVCYSYSLPRQGELVIPEAGMRIQSALIPFSPDMSPRDNHEAIFDLAALTETLTVRNFRHGDRFQPLGMQGHKKLKDLFIEKKVPLEVRSTLPLFLAGEEILWIPSCGRSEVAKVGPGTRQVLRIRLELFNA